MFISACLNVKIICHLPFAVFLGGGYMFIKSKTGRGNRTAKLLSPYFTTNSQTCFNFWYFMKGYYSSLQIWWYWLTPNVENVQRLDLLKIVWCVTLNIFEHLCHAWQVKEPIRKLCRLACSFLQFTERHIPHLGWFVSVYFKTTQISLCRL